MFQLTGPQGKPANSFSGYVFAGGKSVKTLQPPIGVVLDLGAAGAQFTINIEVMGNSIVHSIKSALSPEEPEQIYEVFADDRYSGGTLGFKAENKLEFMVLGVMVDRLEGDPRP
jgi:hypothetical protein